MAVNLSTFDISPFFSLAWDFSKWKQPKEFGLEFRRWLRKECLGWTLGNFCQFHGRRCMKFTRLNRSKGSVRFSEWGWILSLVKRLQHYKIFFVSLFNLAEVLFVFLFLILLNFWSSAGKLVVLVFQIVQWLHSCQSLQLVLLLLLLLVLLLVVSDCTVAAFVSIETSSAGDCQCLSSADMIFVKTFTSSEFLGQILYTKRIYWNKGKFAKIEEKNCMLENGTKNYTACVKVYTVCVKYTQYMY